MNSKEYLEQAITLSREIMANIAELERLQIISTASGAISYENDRVTGSAPQSARFENAVVRLVDLEQEIRKELVELFDRHREIRDVIMRVEDPDVRAVLKMKYLAMKSIRRIATEMFISKSAVQRLMEAGYDEVAKITGLPAPPVWKPPARDRHADSVRIMRDYYRPK